VYLVVAHVVFCDWHFVLHQEQFAAFRQSEQELCALQAQSAAEVAEAHFNAAP